MATSVRGRPQERMPLPCEFCGSTVNRCIPHLPSGGGPVRSVDLSHPRDIFGQQLHRKRGAVQVQEFGRVKAMDPAQQIPARGGAGDDGVSNLVDPDAVPGSECHDDLCVSMAPKGRLQRNRKRVGFWGCIQRWMGRLRAASAPVPDRRRVAAFLPRSVGTSEGMEVSASPMQIRQVGADGSEAACAGIRRRGFTAFGGTRSRNACEVPSCAAFLTQSASRALLAPISSAISRSPSPSAIRSTATARRVSDHFRRPPFRVGTAKPEISLTLSGASPSGNCHPLRQRATASPMLRCIETWRLCTV